MDLLNTLLSGERIDLVSFLSAPRAESTIAHQHMGDFYKAVEQAEREGYLLTREGECEIGAYSEIDEDYFLDDEEWLQKCDDEAAELARTCEELGIANS